MLNGGAPYRHRSLALGILRCAPDTRDILRWPLIAHWLVIPQ